MELGQIFVLFVYHRVGNSKGFPGDSNVHNLYSQMMKPSSLNNDYDNMSLERQLLDLGPKKSKSFFFNLR